MTKLVETKLQPPTPRPGAVERIRLLDRLGREAVPRLVLVSAPPGFGKSTLVAQWIAGLRIPASVAWVSLDAGDADPVRFWRYVATAVERASPGAGAEALGHLEGREGRVDLATAALVNGLAALEQDLLLVLDDLHAVESEDVAAGLAALLDRLPARAHLVVLTRADPPLPVARLRARGELVEARAADLRFTRDEASAYLVERMGLPLGPTDVGTLEARTEGWIAALQLAAISMRGREDVASFVAGFAGDDRYIVDYLADEVLERQPDETRRFLLATSILGRLTGPLCDAVTGGTGGAATLEALERANLFLLPLDDRRRWYRYHHLFADLLRARLGERRPDEVAALHERASDWWAAQDEPREAIAHALAAGRADRAADLVELAAHDLRRTREETTLRGWLDALPDEVYEQRPILAVADAGARLATGEPGRVATRLAMAERWAPAARGPEARAAAEAQGMVVRHATALAHLPGAIALYRGALARLSGDTVETIRQATIALEAATDDQPLERGAAAGILALARWTAGELGPAHEAWSSAIEDLQRAGHRADVLGGLLAMGDIRVAQGRLADARRTFERGLRLGAEASPPLRGTADMHVALAELDLEADDRRGSIAHLDAAAALGEAAGLPQHPHRSRVAAALLRAAEGDLPAAHALLDEAERVHNADFFPVVRPIAAVRARLWVREGRADEALWWAAERGLTDDDPVDLLREYELVTLAAAMLADAGRARAERASALVDRLHAAAVGGGRGRAAIELTALRAIACAAAGDRASALAAMEAAVAAAAPEGFVRLFLDLAPGAVPLLREVARRPSGPRGDDPRAAAHAARVLAAVDEGGAVGGARVPAAAPGRGLVEPLSERELDVLRLLASDLDGPAIAAQLFVSLNTMRTHTKNIFAKLGVNSRRAAVTRGTELGLLARRG